MTSNFFAGRSDALRKLGAEESDETHHGRNALMAGGMAAPWAGVIGQQRMIHEGQGAKVKSYDELLKLLRPGDVLLSGSPDLSTAKGLISAVTGKPEGYHTSVVTPAGIGRRMHWEAHPTYGFQPTTLEPYAHERYQVLRPNFTGAERRHFIDELSNFERGADRIQAGASATLRNAERMPGMSHVIRAGLYNRSEGVSAGWKELLLPKLRSEEAIEAARAKVTAARRKFTASEARDVGRRGAELIAGSPENRIWKGHQMTHLIPDCVSGVCSTVPAGAMPAGRHVVPGKLPSEILPSDYLRSKHFTPVALYDPAKASLHDKLLRHAPTAVRLGLGAALAGGVYGGSKLWERFRAKREEAHL